MTNVVLICRDRERLTDQCITSLYQNTAEDQFNLTVVSDGSQPPTMSVLRNHADIHWKNLRLIQLHDSIGIVGWLRNMGASASERYFGRGEYLCFIDNDIAFRPNWLQKMQTVMCMQSHPKILGGYRHPFHGVNAAWSNGSVGWESTDAVAGYMHFMTWETWDNYGIYDQHSKGICQSEDFSYCRKIVEDGGKVGYIHPPVIVNCGITNSMGEPAVGSDQFLRLPEYIYE